MGKSIEVPQKITNKTIIYDLAILLLGIYPMFIAAICTIAKIRKQPNCPLTDEWIKKRW